jgi:hypothetical protein
MMFLKERNEKRRQGGSVGDRDGGWMGGWEVLQGGEEERSLQGIGGMREANCSAI